MLVVAAVLYWDGLFSTNELAPDTLAPPSRLVGKWRRGDGGYVLDIQRVHEDGKIDAKYLNPRPIRVSKATAITRGGHVVVAVTLQDKGYPGSNYTLTYNPDTDRLDGVYYHRGLKQQFDVTFVRVNTVPSTQQ